MTLCSHVKMERQLSRFSLPVLIFLMMLLTACTLTTPASEGRATNAPTTQPTSAGSGGVTPDGDECDVTRVIDGDTIEVRCGEVGYRVRYIAVNTPESDEICYDDAKDANDALVANKRVTLVRDESNTDPFGRLLRYVYVDGTFVNEALVRGGWAEAVIYPPDDLHYDDFLALEKTASSQNVGCHPTGIFDDGSDRR